MGIWLSSEGLRLYNGDSVAVIPVADLAVISYLLIAFWTGFVVARNSARYYKRVGEFGSAVFVGLFIFVLSPLWFFGFCAVYLALCIVCVIATPFTETLWIPSPKRFWKDASNLFRSL